MKKVSHFSAKIKKIIEIANKDPEKIYKALNVDYRLNNTYISSPCFIHGGDNTFALNYYFNIRSSDDRPHWKCRTHYCDAVFNNSLLGLVRGALSHRKYKWSGEGDKVVSTKEAIDFICKIYNIDLDTLEVESQNSITEIDYFCNKLANEFSQKSPQHTLINRNYILSTLSIPSQYYLTDAKDKFTEETLRFFDVGECLDPDKEMYNRAVVPIYDESGNNLIGASGRSIFPECNKCRCYHKPGPYCNPVSKWKHTESLNGKLVLYNFHNAIKHIAETKTVILVESPGNVWRLYEAGIYNAVALLGGSLTKEKRKLLNKSGCLNVILILDNDIAGQNASKLIKKNLENIYNVYELKLTSYNDVASMPKEYIIDNIKPTIQHICNKYKYLF